MYAAYGLAILSPQLNKLMCDAQNNGNLVIFDTEPHSRAEKGGSLKRLLRSNNHCAAQRLREWNVSLSIS